MPDLDEFPASRRRIPTETTRRSPRRDAPNDDRRSKSDASGNPEGRIASRRRRRRRRENDEVLEEEIQTAGCRESRQEHEHEHEREQPEKIARPIDATGEKEV